MNFENILDTFYAENVNMFLKLKRDSSGYPYCVRSEKTKRNTLTTAHRGNCSRQGVHFLKCGANGHKIRTRHRQHLLPQKIFYELLTSPCTQFTSSYIPER